MINVFDAIEVIKWLFLGLFLPGLIVIGASFLASFILYLIGNALGWDWMSDFLSDIIVPVGCVAGTIVLFFNYPWWLSLWGYTDQYLILASYVALVIGGGFSASLNRD